MRTIILIIVLFTACKDDDILIPKPRIYPKVVYPEKVYAPFENAACPFEMQIPDYFEFIKDDKQTGNEKKFKCWFDLYCQELNTYLHFSYVNFNTRSEFDGLVSDVFEMVDKHNIKASYRDEVRINKPDAKVHGLIFDIDGPVATPVQFYMTDSTQHFIRGSLYFKSKVNRDSIAPVYDFFKQDINELIGSFEWK